MTVCIPTFYFTYKKLLIEILFSISLQQINYYLLYKEIYKYREAIIVLLYKVSLDSIQRNWADFYVTELERVQ